MDLYPGPRLTLLSRQPGEHAASIAPAAEQQSAVAEEINRSVLNVREVSDQTSAASEEPAASSVELARLGTHLQMLVGRFRI